MNWSGRRCHRQARHHAVTRREAAGAAPFTAGALLERRARGAGLTAAADTPPRAARCLRPGAEVSGSADWSLLQSDGRACPSAVAAAASRRLSLGQASPSAERRPLCAARINYGCRGARN